MTKITPTLSPEAQFLINLDAAREHWRTTNNDPHGIAVAVMVALLEARNAFAKAHGKPVK